MRGGRLLLPAALLLAVGCGDHGGPPARPTPTAALPTFDGAYVLTVEPAPECAAPVASISINVTVSRSDSSRYVGLSVVTSASRPVVEMELQYVGPNVRGGLGTVGAGYAVQDGVQAWIHAIGSGPVSADASGSGEVVRSTLVGGVTFGAPGDDERFLTPCNSDQHHWSLRRS